MIKKILNTFSPKHYRYLIVGSLVFVVNYLVAKLIFNLDIFTKDSLYRNLGNFIAMEIALLISFPLHKRITWAEGWEDFFPKLFHFHLISSFTIFIRIVSFSIFDSFGFYWEVSSILSISLVVIINFAGFDRYVFLKQEEIASNDISYNQGAIGVETLETIEDAKTYNYWISEKFTDYLGKKNIELGAGTGTIAEFVSQNFELELFELSEVNQIFLKKDFKKIQI